MTDKSKRNFLKGILASVSALFVGIPSSVAKKLDGKPIEEQQLLIDDLVKDGFMKQRTALRWKLKNGILSKEEFKNLSRNVKEISQEEDISDHPRRHGSPPRSGNYAVLSDENIEGFSSFDLEETEGRKEYNEVLKKEFDIDPSELNCSYGITDSGFEKLVENLKLKHLLRS